MKVINTERLPIKMWLDDIEDSALEQAKNLANLPFAFKWVALMPDSHAGSGMPIGGVLATEQVIVPNAVGSDISCGVLAVKTSLTNLDTVTIKRIMGHIRECIPVGFNHNKEKQDWDGFHTAPDEPIVQRELESARYQLASMGGGNHFLEIQSGSDGHIWYMLHSGSRNIGFKVAAEYHKIAVKMCRKWYSNLPTEDLAFLPVDTREGKQYFEAMKFCMAFAHANREYMATRINYAFAREVEMKHLDKIHVNHNYAAWENHFGKNVIVHRKGATKATAGLRGIIPGSMGTSSYIVEGLGNPQSFMSCSHGAGRRMGRKEAIRSLDLEVEQKRMEGIVHGLRSQGDLDEAPSAYKDIDEVMANQTDLVKILVKLTPLGVVKG